MTGILLIGVAALWLWFAIWFGRKLGGQLPQQPWRMLLQLALIALLIPLPLVDEIVGGWQFRKLCRQHDSIRLDRESAKGKTVYFEVTPEFPIKGFWVPVVQRPKHFLDTTTNEQVLSYERFIATGGLFIRSLGISEGNVPLTFASYCEPGGLVQYNDLFKDLNITLIQRKDTHQGETK